MLFSIRVRKYVYFYNFNLTLIRIWEIFKIKIAILHSQKFSSPYFFTKLERLKK